MWLIRLALRRPITIMVIVAAIALSSILAVMRTRVDIFPTLDLPVIYVAQPYGGMSPQQMEGFLSYYYEYHFLYINGLTLCDSFRRWDFASGLSSLFKSITYVV